MIGKIIILKDKYKLISAPVKASIWFAICNILQKGISIITVPLFTRLLTTQQYGLYSVYQSWYSVIVVFATLNLYYGVFNNGMLKFSEARDQYTSSMQSLTTTITILLFIMYIIASNLWNNIFGLADILVYAMFLELVFMPAYSFWAARQRFEYKYKALVVVTLIMAIGSPLLGIIAVLNTTYKAEARILSFVLVQICIGLFFYIRNLKKGKTIYVTKYWKYALGFNIPLIPHYLSQSVLQQSDRLMISSMVGAGEVAIYSVAYNVSTLMILVTSAINNSFIPYTYKCLSEKNYSDLKHSATALIALVGIGTFLVVAFGPEVIKIFAPTEYYEAVWIIPPVSASIFFMFLYPIFGNVEFYYEENRFVMFASIIGASANVVLNYIFIPIFGYIVAGYTTLGCYILFASSHYIFMKKVIKKHKIKDSVYNIKMIIVFSVIILTVTLGMLLLYRFTLLRYTLIIFMIIVIVFKRNLIIASLKVIRKQ